MLTTLVGGLEVDSARILIVEIYERSFKRALTLSFLCLIFHLCSAARVPIWHCDNLIEATKMVDIGLIQDDINLAAPQREPQVDLPPLGANLAIDVEQIKVDDTTIPPTTTDVEAPPSTSTSVAASSSRAIPSSGSTNVPLARV
ncbi:hypothetical protein MTR67_039989 [Solanum verrucosum]|uniref:Integrase core domain containing protein n=1 Tax=Solanum verrucosum TaxID=315347 RepID=A0AAF0UK06_SOLVR|nr:hypothetical protein MTR67_039989 [Solanum verrucosum]